MTALKQFKISTISRKLNGINARLTVARHHSFPCLLLLSRYRFKKSFVKILLNGDVQGGYSKMIVSLIDFSFVRSLAAPAYKVQSPATYDPPSIFLLELFRYIDRYPSMDQFLAVLRDRDRGRAYRTYAGISRHIPTKATFSNFKDRIGPDRYNEIFHVLVDLFHQLQMITFKVIAHDGTLFPTRARYRGCTCFSENCARMDITDIIFKVRRQIMYRLNNLSKVNLEKEFRIKVPCPNPDFPEQVKRPRLEVIAMKLGVTDGKPSSNQINTATLFGVKQELDKHQLGITIIRSKIIEIKPDQDHAVFRCHKLPKDTDARIGVRRDPANSSKKQKIFGYNLVLSTSVEPDLKLELPVAATNIAGNALEGKQIITNTQQINDHHDCQTKIDLADAKYDSTENYAFLRQNGSIPFIDYNPRREKLTAEALRTRGYDQNGWPFAPCGIPTKPNGFDEKRGRHTFCCFKQCLDLKATGIKNLWKDYDIPSCEHLEKQTGCSTHAYIKDHPRLLNEVLRGTKRYHSVKKIRSASERANSTIKEVLKILEKPIVYNKRRADILTQITAIVLLLHKAFAFIVRISGLFAVHQASDNPDPGPLETGHVPKSIHSLIQQE